MKFPWLPRPRIGELLVAATLVGLLLFAAFWLVLGSAPPLFFWGFGWLIIMAIAISAASEREPDQDRESK